MSGTPEYYAFHNAHTRCTWIKSNCWKDYGGRGIQFLFTSFEQFFAEVGLRPSPEHSLDRIDVNGHYGPGNIRWATKDVQLANRRCSNVVAKMDDLGGETIIPITEPAEQAA